jgi:hypothetical protein
MSAVLSATETVAPVAGTTAGIWNFPSSVDTIMIDNLNVGVDLYCRFDGSAATALSGGYQLRILDDAGSLSRAVDLGVGGRLQCISIWVPAGGTVANIRISGWREGI